VKIDLKKILVVDIEATCWETKSDMPNEIIEIGCCMIDMRTLANMWRDSIVVRPQQSTISPYCTTLTGWTPEAVMKGLSFQDACARVRDHGGTNITWASYGYYDQKQFRKECAQKDVKYPFSDRHINVKNLAAIAYNLPVEVGMPEMADKMGIQLSGRLHNGMDDAVNIANILTTILRRMREQHG
jgi:inhibitor of KinA sporulation pathway (predicted exonuclease)